MQCQVRGGKAAHHTALNQIGEVGEKGLAPTHCNECVVEVGNSGHAVNQRVPWGGGECSTHPLQCPLPP